MHRFRRTSYVVLLTAFASAAWTFACSSDDSEVAATTTPDASLWDATPVAPLDGSTKTDGGNSGPSPTCESYCKDVVDTCTGDNAQYGAPEECIWFCARMPEGSLGDKDVDTLACRAYHASTTAKTDAKTWCAAAGPFGGGVCGDRCGAFCKLTLAVCTAKTGTGSSPWASEPDCVTACAGFDYLDGGTDGGGEGANGPAYGDTLNCRLRSLREALRDPARCADLAPDSGACR